MSGRAVLIALLAAAVAGFAAGRLSVDTGEGPHPAARPADGVTLHAESASTSHFVCPMHSDVVADSHQSCPICGMDLVKRAGGSTAAVDPGEHATVTIAPAVVHNLGVRTAVVERGPLQSAVETVGKIIRVSPALRRDGSAPVVEVKADIFERQWGRVAVGQSATMTLRSLSGSVFHGKVIHVESPDDYMAHELEVALRFRAADSRLSPGMFAQLRILAPARSGVLTIPRSAVIPTAEGDRVVRVRGDGGYQPVEVTLGEAAGERVEVRSGLEPGDLIVASGQFLIDSESHLLSGLRRMTAAGVAD